MPEKEAGFSRRSALRMAGAAALATASAAPLTLGASPALAAPQEAVRRRPRFLVPFPYRQRWFAYTHAWHWERDRMSDWVRADGRVTEDSPVLSSAMGRVVDAGIHPQGSPYAGVSFLEVDHGAGWSSVYYHMKVESFAPVGCRVRAGDRIGVVGAVGLRPDDPTGPHLHYEQQHEGVLMPLYLFRAPFVPPAKPERALIISDNRRGSQ